MKNNTKRDYFLEHEEEIAKVEQLVNSIQVAKGAECAKSYSTKVTSAIPSRDISFVDLKSTIIFGTARSGKSALMSRWAKELQETNRPFVYFLTRWHVTERGDGSISTKCESELHGGINFTGLLVPAGEFKADGGLALIQVNDFVNDHEDIEATTQDEVFKALDDAINAGYHVFLDENQYRYDMLLYLQRKGYNSYTCAMQGVSDYEKYFYDVREVSSDRILIGRLNENYASKIFNKIGISIEPSLYMRLKPNEFCLAQRNKDGI